MPSVFLVKRTQVLNPDHPPYMVCSSARVARHEAGDTGAKATVWQVLGRKTSDRAMLLIRWCGLDVDYADNSMATELPDRSWTGLHYPGNLESPWAMFKNAIWWSTAEMPKWCHKRGVLEVSSLEASQMPTVLDRLIKEAEALTEKTKRYGARAFGYRQLPAITLEIKRPGQTMLLPGFGDPVPGTEEKPAKERQPRKPRKDPVQVEAEKLRNSCMRCGECENSDHHWLPNPDFGNDPDESEHSVEHSHICKHCPVYGDECPACKGTGCNGDPKNMATKDCPECDGDGVKLFVAAAPKKSRKPRTKRAAETTETDQPSEPNQA